MVADSTGIVVIIGIDPSAIAEPISVIDPALARSVHEELLEALAINGRLIFTCESDRASFLDQVRNLPSGVAKLWETVLASGRIRLEVLDPPVEPGLAQTLDPQELADHLGAKVDLILLEREHGNCSVCHRRSSVCWHPVDDRNSSPCHGDSDHRVVASAGLGRRAQSQG
ncbi:MAG: hypothetical protein ACOYD1_06785 [Candidatus Nanopelagicales bacterium]